MKLSNNKNIFKDPKQKNNNKEKHIPESQSACLSIYLSLIYKTKVLLNNILSWNILLPKPNVKSHTFIVFIQINLTYCKIYP